MIDPVLDSEGNTYERSAIELWIEGHNTSPITRNVITRHELRPNRSLKNAIEEILATGREILPRLENHVGLTVAATISVPELSLTVTTQKLRQEWLDAKCPAG